MNQNRQPEGIPAGGQYATTPRQESPTRLEQAPPRITLEFEPNDADQLIGHSCDGWGTKALIVPPSEGDGESYYWRVSQLGQVFDGRVPLDCDCEPEDECECGPEEAENLAIEQAQAEANRMLAIQEARGIDWSALDEDEEYDDDWW